MNTEVRILNLLRGWQEIYCNLLINWPIMPAYSPMPKGTFYAWNYASIIHQCLLVSHAQSPRVLARPFPKGTVPLGPLWVCSKTNNMPFGPLQNQHIFNSHLNSLNLKTVWALNVELSEHWTEIKCFVDSSTHATNVWYWQSIHSRWWAWSWDIICVLWPVNSGENTAVSYATYLQYSCDVDISPINAFNKVVQYVHVTVFSCQV